MGAKSPRDYRDNIDWYIDFQSGPCVLAKSFEAVDYTRCIEPQSVGVAKTKGGVFQSREFCRIYPLSKGTAHVIIQGFYGTDLAEYIGLKFGEILESLLRANVEPPKALHQTFLDLQAAVENSFPHQESTLIVVYREGSKIWCANISRSAAFFISETQLEARLLSNDISLEENRFQKEIRQNGGVIIRHNGLLTANRSVNARAIGSTELSKCTSPAPEIIEISLKNHESGFIVLVSPGLRVKASERQIGEFVLAHREKIPEEIATLLVKQAFRAGSILNISAIVAKVTS